MLSWLGWGDKSQKVQEPTNLLLLLKEEYRVSNTPSKVEEINFCQKNCGGIIPKEIAELFPKLKLLYLSNNNLRGSIPTLSNIVDIEELVLEGNRLSGEIPASIGELKNLKSLYFS